MISQNKEEKLNELLNDKEFNFEKAAREISQLQVNDENILFVLFQYLSFRLSWITVKWLWFRVKKSKMFYLLSAKKLKA